MSVEAHITRVAQRHHGNVSYEQLRHIGLSREAVRHRRRRGLLIDRYRGVYAVGAVRTDFLSRASAAQLATDAAITGMSAACVYRAADEPGDPIHLLRASKADRRDGLVVHRGDPGELWERRSLSLTSPARTLVEIASREPEATVVRVYNELQVLRLLTPDRFATFLAGLSGRRGLGLLRELAGSSDGVSRSTLEDLLRPLLIAAKLPVPAFNARVRGFEVDALWEREKVIVELDGRRFHDTDVRFESDRARDARLAVSGYVVLRFTHRRLSREPQAVIAEIAGLLAVRQARPVAC